MDPSAPERSSLPVTEIVRAIYDFQGQNNDELCIQKGNLITLTQTPEGGWYEGTFEGVTGWFPSNYVESVAGDLIIEEHLSSEDLVQIPDKSNCLQYRKLVIKEISDTEAAYIQELKHTYQQYLLPLLKNSILPEKELSAIVEAFVEIIKVHSSFLTCLENVSNESGKDQRIGGIFMNLAPKMKIVHLNYCSLHPAFVSIIDKNKESVSVFMKQHGGSEVTGNGSVLLTSSLSFSFRRLDKYPALLQELQRYTDECHPDRGDTQRAGFLYREIVSLALELRRHKEMELEVMLGNIRNWPSDLGTIDALGPIIRMGSVTVVFSPGHGNEILKDHYLVLFERSLLLLSVSNEMTSFTFEYNLQLEEMTVPRLPEASSLKLTFELLVPSLANESMTDRFIFQCTSVEEVKNWISVMLKCKTSETDSLLRRATGQGSFRRSTRGQTASQITSSAPSATPDISGRQTLVTSESSSLSSGSSLNFRPSQGSITSYWVNRSLLPHAPLRASVNADQSIKTPLTSSSAYMTTPKEELRQQPSLASDDMTILQVIESYYFTGRKNQPPPSLSSQASSKTTSFGNGKKQNGPSYPYSSLVKPAAEQRPPLVVTVDSLVNEIKQMRSEIDSLADCMRRERRARKRLKHFVGKLALDVVVPMDT
ncbi:Rho guanine nucleotide exchange factor 6 [Halotydeus destructor]|nr:Rho guanine nucleotide exchange factor 6 [Halotydeus destructor]